MKDSELLILAVVALGAFYLFSSSSPSKSASPSTSGGRQSASSPMSDLGGRFSRAGQAAFQAGTTESALRTDLALAGAGAGLGGTVGTAVGAGVGAVFGGAPAAVGAPIGGAVGAAAGGLAGAGVGFLTNGGRAAANAFFGA